MWEGQSKGVEAGDEVSRITNKEKASLAEWERESNVQQGLGQYVGARLGRVIPEAIRRKSLELGEQMGRVKADFGTVCGWR